ncbi:unnamed protein product [Didymodactylos carnosus]|uniref:Uncharacterized protein n=1 Tax=Didymodactylos carnosus TaxID=1234261 RepID=A0A8S2TVU3_9BILA|nr:unnamed protein product [Didymodactylos carnosus]CAF4310278.1 unnamed protein product [Didymodactylos carnosus]
MPNVPITMTSSNCSACKYSCRCTIDPIFMSMNCSSYLLNITYDGCSTDWYEINFSSRNLEYLNHDTFKQLRTKRLLLKSNLISLIDDTTFTSMSVILEYLDLQLNQLQQLTNWIPTLKTQLKELNIASNQLETLTHLETLTKLEVLNVSRNQIHVFPKELHYLISLITLDLSYNKLSSIPRYALNGLTNLTYLSFASNRNLSCIIQDSFKYLKSLKYLDLSSTNLKDLDACSFNQLVKLQILKIELVPLNCTSCWLRIAYENNIQTLGQCIDVTQTFNLSNSLSTLSRWCQTTAVNCSTDYCEPGTFGINTKLIKTDSNGQIY